MAGWRKKRISWKMLLIPVCFVAVLAVAACICLRLTIGANLEDISEMRAEVLISRAVNRALIDQFEESDINQEDLFILDTDDDGKLMTVQANSVEINKFLTQLSVNLQESFQEMNDESFSVSVGTLLGSKLLSGMSPEVDIKIKPMSVLSTDFQTELESKGINQTKYKIYIILTCRIKVLAPFVSDSFDTSSTVLIAETVILGEVPENYVVVPDDNILDVTN